MKNMIRNILILSFLFLGTSILMISCDYKELADADYPDQMVYMPTAVNGIYDVSNVPDTIAVPTPGNPYRYLIDNSTGKVIIPLGVYRAGVNNKGSFVVNITVVSDTISELIADGTLTETEILPSVSYSLPTSVRVEDGKDNQGFNIDIDLDFIKSNLGKKYAIGVKISTHERQINDALSTTIVLINTSLLKLNE